MFKSQFFWLLIEKTICYMFLNFVNGARFEIFLIVKINVLIENYTNLQNIKQTKKERKLMKNWHKSVLSCKSSHKFWIE